ncbi:MAG: efflux RND transporter permease subunit, partial [Pseudomonadota bacterium]
YGETPLVAAFRGTRQVGFAVVATTMVLVSVFVPITFLQGDIGRLFSEFALTMAAAVCFSSLIALTLSPMLASKILHQEKVSGWAAFLPRLVGKAFDVLRGVYGWFLRLMTPRPLLAFLAMFIMIGSGYVAIQNLKSEYVPREDRGGFFIVVRGPEGASYTFMERYMDEIERRLLPYIETSDVDRLLLRAPGFGSNAFNQGFVVVNLEPWGTRRPADDIISEVNGKLADLPGVRAFAIMRQGLGGRQTKPIQFVVGGPSYEKLAEWRDTFIDALQEADIGLIDIESDYNETQPQFRINIDYQRASDLGVTVADVGTTLQTMLGSRRVTTYLDDGEEYDVILEGVREDYSAPNDIRNIFVRSERTGALVPLSNLVTIREAAGSPTLNRYNRVRAVTIEAGLAPDAAMGTVLNEMVRIGRDVLPDEAVFDFKGQSLDYQTSGSSILFVFAIGCIIVFLVLAAQFESYIHPMVIMLCVPATLAAGLAGLFISGETLNIYTQIGLIMLVGLSAKNGILIVEFANQLRDEGIEFDKALEDAALTRFRPIFMTGLTTMAGALPLLLSSGAGAETRQAIGSVILFGVIGSTIATLILVPPFYSLFARKTGSPGDVARRLDEESDLPTAIAEPAE